METSVSPCSINPNGRGELVRSHNDDDDGDEKPASEIIIYGLRGRKKTKKKNTADSNNVRKTNTRTLD